MIAADRIDYKKTGSFSTIVLDYLEGKSQLQDFFEYAPDITGIKAAIQKKKMTAVNRQLLVDVLKRQYQMVSAHEKVNRNIEALLSGDCFTICTAHQPNLFTGPLYFIYKIIHAIRLADELKKQLPENDFVPVFYMGSEDADFDELNHFTVSGKKYTWTTKQKGAVGRMKVDDKLIDIITQLQQQISSLPYAAQIINTLKASFIKGRQVQDATFAFVHELFSDYGLVILIPDDAQLKKQMIKVFEDDLFRQVPSSIVAATCEKLSEHYSLQAHPREINLFYLKDDVRERIIQQGDIFKVLHTDINFSKEELEKELRSYPERFSPNVILRGLYQEMILPDVAFIGGGGELAYWLQLKDLFINYQVPFPPLVLRNSFLVIEKKWQQRIDKLGLPNSEIFHPEEELLNAIVKKESKVELSLNGKLANAQQLFREIRMQAQTIDPTLSGHVNALEKRHLNALEELEKKMLRAQKRKFADRKEQIHKLKETLFPKKGLQERVENIALFYSLWGPEFIKALYDHSPAMEQQFTILTEQES